MSFDINKKCIYTNIYKTIQWLWQNEFWCKQNVYLTNIYMAKKYNGYGKTSFDINMF